MIRKEKQNHLKWQSKTLYILLALGIVLWSSSVANGKPRPIKKTPSSKTLRSMARVYMAYGEYAKAQPLAEKALTLARRKGTSDSELAMCLIDLATLYKNQNKLVDAERMCELGLKLQKKVLYKNHPYLAYTLSASSSIYCEQGKYYQARSALEEAMAIMLDAHSANDKAMAPFFVDIAKLHVAQGDLEEAERYYQKAMLLINSSYGPDHLYTANVLTGIAKLYTLQERYDEAEKLINRAVTVQEKIYGSDHHLIATSWLIKAKIYQVKGDTTQAEKLINKALIAIENSGNTAAFAKFQQDAKEIRVSRQVAFAHAIW
ncbi:MAG: tetratricopeptide repeat protein [Planctomycetota bacterium]|jgi:tetratricopeptide (TPR) repeat protein